MSSTLDKLRARLGSSSSTSGSNPFVPKVAPVVPRKRPHVDIADEREHGCESEGREEEKQNRGMLESHGATGESRGNEPSLLEDSSTLDSRHSHESEPAQKRSHTEEERVISAPRSTLQLSDSSLSSSDPVSRSHASMFRSRDMGSSHGEEPDMTEQIPLSVSSNSSQHSSFELPLPMQRNYAMQERNASSRKSGQTRSTTSEAVGTGYRDSLPRSASRNSLNSDSESVTSRSSIARRRREEAAARPHAEKTVSDFARDSISGEISQRYLEIQEEKQKLRMARAEARRKREERRREKAKLRAEREIRLAQRNRKRAERNSILEERMSLGISEEDPGFRNGVYETSDDDPAWSNLSDSSSDESTYSSVTSHRDELLSRMSSQVDIRREQDLNLSSRLGHLSEWNSPAVVAKDGRIIPVELSSLERLTQDLEQEQRDRMDRMRFFPPSYSSSSLFNSSDSLSLSGSRINQFTFSRRRAQRSKPWTKAETHRFYDALQQIGPDFGLIAKLFPDRERKEIRNKFKKEEKIHPHRIDMCLKHQKPIDEQSFLALLDTVQKEVQERIREKFGVEGVMDDSIENLPDSLLQSEDSSKRVEDNEMEEDFDHREDEFEDVALEEYGDELY